MQKRLFALLLAAAMVFSLGAVAFADGETEPVVIDEVGAEPAVIEETGEEPVVIEEAGEEPVVIGEDDAAEAEMVVPEDVEIVTIPEQPEEPAPEQEAEPEAEEPEQTPAEPEDEETEQEAEPEAEEPEQDPEQEAELIAAEAEQADGEEEPAQESEEDEQAAPVSITIQGLTEQIYAATEIFTDGYAGDQLTGADLPEVWTLDPDVISVEIVLNAGYALREIGGDHILSREYISVSSEGEEQTLSLYALPGPEDGIVLEVYEDAEQPTLCEVTYTGDGFVQENCVINPAWGGTFMFILQGGYAVDVDGCTIIGMYPISEDGDRLYEATADAEQITVRSIADGYTLTITNEDEYPEAIFRTGMNGVYSDANDVRQVGINPEAESVFIDLRYGYALEITEGSVIDDYTFNDSSAWFVSGGQIVHEYMFSPTSDITVQIMKLADDEVTTPIHIEYANPEFFQFGNPGEVLPGASFTIRVDEGYVPVPDVEGLSISPVGDPMDDTVDEYLVSFTGDSGAPGSTIVFTAEEAQLIQVNILGAPDSAVFMWNGENVITGDLLPDGSTLEITALDASYIINTSEEVSLSGNENGDYITVFDSDGDGMVDIIVSPIVKVQFTGAVDALPFDLSELPTGFPLDTPFAFQLPGGYMAEVEGAMVDQDRYFVSPEGGMYRFYSVRLNTEEGATINIVPDPDVPTPFKVTYVDPDNAITNKDECAYIFPGGEIDLYLESTGYVIDVDNGSYGGYDTFRWVEADPDATSLTVTVTKVVTDAVLVVQGDASAVVPESAVPWLETFYPMAANGQVITDGFGTVVVPNGYTVTAVSGCKVIPYSYSYEGETPSPDKAIYWQYTVVALDSKAVVNVAPDPATTLRWITLHVHNPHEAYCVLLPDSYREGETDETVQVLLTQNTFRLWVDNEYTPAVPGITLTVLDKDQYDTFYEASVDPSVTELDLYILAAGETVPTPQPTATATSTAKPGSAAPKTGDETDVALYAGALALCMGGLAVCLFPRRKKNSK